jgi:SSS family transporter
MGFRLIFFSCVYLLFPSIVPREAKRMSPTLKPLAAVDFVVIAAYMALMLVIGVYAMRFNRGTSDYFKGGSRVHWLAAGLSSFMSGFSAWTFTGAAGLAYREGLVAVLLYVGNACTFLLGYWLFAARWRRARIGTVMEYLVDRYDERTRQAFSWTTIAFQLFTGAAMLYGLAVFVAPAFGWPVSWTIVGSQAVILAYCVIGGLWAVVITDFVQAAILLPFTVVMCFASLARLGGFDGLVAGLPPSHTSLALPAGFGLGYVFCWTVMTSVGYNTAAMAQRYISVEDERAARKVALLCFSLFLVGAFVWFVPPLAMRVLHPDLRAVWPGLANPHESSYALAALTLLPSGLVGIMLAAMFSATMSSLSGVFNLHASIISRDIFPTLFPRRAGEAEKLTVAWSATFAVGIVIMGIALAMAAGGHSVFGAMVTFNTVMSLAYGPPALLGLVVRGTPSWSGLASFAVGLGVGAVGSFALGWGVVANVLAVVPVSVAVFLLSRFFPETNPAHAARRADLFRRLDTPVNVPVELRDTHDPTAEVFRFLSRTTGLVGLLCLPFVFTSPPHERATAGAYVAITLAVAAGLGFVRGARRPGPAATTATAALLVALGGGAAPAAAGVRAVWAVSDGEKVERDERAHPLTAKNAVWDGRTVRVAAARNEIVAFQVIVEADEAGIRALSAALPELRRRGGGGLLTYAPPSHDSSLSAGRPIQLFAAHYLNVTAPSHADWAWKPGSPAAPPDPTGWKPVQLVPENARQGRGGFPLAVPASLGQALWVELYVGRDLPAGAYEGSLRLAADGATRELPIELRVFDFALPDANSLTAMVYFEPDQPELFMGRSFDAAFHRFAHRQRIELVHAYDEAQLEAARGRFDGSDFTIAKGYEGPGEGKGNTLAPASFYGTGRAYAERESAWARSDAWMSFLAKSFPSLATFLYLPDEPYPDQYPEVRRLAGHVRSNPGPGGKLPTFVTKRPVPELDGSIDIWCVPAQALDPAVAAAERAKGRRVWAYNGARPQAPALLVDTPATDPRVVAWAFFKHDVPLYFFWHSVHWKHNSQKQGERVQNVWASPVTFDNRGQPRKPVEDQGFLNGDGVLLYPGLDVLHPDQDRGIEGPVGTVQLANLRRGLQDHQYLTLARRLGLESEVQAALRRVVPRVFSEAGETVGFAETGETFEASRLALAEAIEARIAKDEK